MSEYEEVIVRMDKSNSIIGEIVRCKDCRWYQNYDGCFFSTAEVESLDYCSHGERKTEEESVREVVRGFMELVDATADRKTEPSFKVDGIGDDDTTIHAIAYLQKVGWLQEHDRALTEPSNSEIPNNCKPQTERTCTNCKHNGVLSVPKCDECHDMDKHEFIEPQTDCAWKEPR